MAGCRPELLHRPASFAHGHRTSSPRAPLHKAQAPPHALRCSNPAAVRKAPALPLQVGQGAPGSDSGGGSVDTFTDQHTNALGRAARGGAQCSSSYVERSDRSKGPVGPVAGVNRRRPMNARSRGTPSGQAHVRLF